MNDVRLGNALTILESLPDDSIDAIVTDPPYGLGTKEPTIEQIEAYLRGAPLAPLKRGRQHCANYLAGVAVVRDTESQPLQDAVTFRILFPSIVVDPKFGEPPNDGSLCLRKRHSFSGCAEGCRCFARTGPTSFRVLVWLRDNPSRNAECSLVTARATEIRAVLTLDVGSRTGSLVPADSTDDPDAGLLLTTPEDASSLSSASSLLASLQVLLRGEVPTYGTRSFDVSIPTALLDRFHSPYLPQSDFMGKAWDFPSVELWRVAYRKLRPGRHVCVFAGCYDECTEVLTRNGWVRFPDVVGDEEFASLNLETHKVEWQRAKEVIRQPHPGGMFQYATKKVDLLVTPNHNMLVAPLGASESTFRLERADQHSNAIRMTKTSRGRADTADPGSFILPAVTQTTSRGHEVEVPAKVIPLEVWLAFFGLWLAEGSLVRDKPHNGHKHGFSYIVSISHLNTNNLRVLQEMLGQWFDVRVYSRTGKLRIDSKQLVEYLDQFGYAWDRFIPDWIKALPARYLHILWDWYTRGDGDRRTAYTCSPRLRDDWQEVALYMGMSADWRECKDRAHPSRIKDRVIHQRRPQYEISFHRVQNQPEIYLRQSRKNPVRTFVSAEEWAGRMVYCVELERHHTLYVRRNGKAVWCGNTRTWDIMLAGLEAAGFTREGSLGEPFGAPMLSWLHGQGFPKSTNISKAILKAGGSEEEAKKWEGWGTALKPAWEPIITLRKPGPVPEGLPPLLVPFLYCAKVTKSEADAGIDKRLVTLGMSTLERNTHPCLHPESLVMTPSGYREIGSMGVGDLVLAADGRFHPVEAVSRHPYTSRSLVRISVQGTNLDCLASDNHPFLIWRPSRHHGHITEDQVLWVRADELVVGDCTLTPVMPEAAQWDAPKPEDPDFWFLVGLYLARGYVQKAEHGDNVYPTFCLSDSETDLVERIRACVNSNVTVCRDKVTVFDAGLGSTMRELCGSGTARKTLAPCVWSLSLEAVEALVKGYFAGDGGLVRTHQQAKILSRNLASQMRFLAESVGFKTELQYCKPEPGGIGGGAYYVLHLNTRDQALIGGSGQQPSGPTLLEHEGHTYLLSYVKDVSWEPYVGDVVNLSVEGSPTFQTSVGMSHNTRKPVTLMRWIIRHTARLSELVVDPFCGSGSTGVAAIDLGCDFLGIEIDGVYREIALKRLEQARATSMAGARVVFDMFMETDD